MTKKTNDEIRAELDAIMQGHLTEKKMKQNDKLIISNNAANKIKAQDPEWRKNVAVAAIKRTQDPEWRKNIADGAIKRSNDPEWRRKIGELNRKKAADPNYIQTLKDARAKYKDDPDYREKLRKAQQRRLNDETYLNNHQKGIDNRSNHPTWKENVSKSRKPVLTPYGIFASINDAGNILYEKGYITTTSVTPLIAVKLKIKWNIKHYPTEWKFLTREEYERLTNNHI